MLLTTYRLQLGSKDTLKTVFLKRNNISLKFVFLASKTFPDRLVLFGDSVNRGALFMQNTVLCTVPWSLVHYNLFTLYCELYPDLCILCTVPNAHCTVPCSLYTLLSSLSYVHHVWYPVHCTLHCTMYYVHY